MHTHADNSKETKNASAADLSEQKKDDGVRGLMFEGPDGDRARKLQKMADGSEQVKQLKDLQSKADNFKPATTGKPVVQRAIQVEGVPQTADNVSAHFNGTPQQLNARQEEILQLWVSANRVHNFEESQGRTAWSKVRSALQSAEQMSAAPKPALFSAANFRFLTKEGGRFATYYFEGGGQTGRMRQQHISGPLAQVDAVANQRISFANRADRGVFVAALRTSRTNGTPFVPPNPVTWNAPAAGQSLLEYHMAGNVAAGLHPSGGLIENKVVTEAAVTKIYNKIVGLPNPGGGCFITTACMIAKGLPDNCEELEILRNYRDTYLLYRKHGMELFKFYYTYSPAIVEGINAHPESYSIYSGLYNVIRQCVHAIRRRDLEEAFQIYVEMVLTLQINHAPGMPVPPRLYKILQNSLLTGH